MVAVPIDRGWAWMCVLGAGICSFVVVGGLKSLGIILVEIVWRFGASSATASVMMALVSMGVSIIAPLSTTLGDRFSYRAVIIVGGALCAFANFATAFGTNATYVVVVFGTFTGAGFGCIAGTSLVVVGMYFNKHRSLANGLAVSGGSAGQLIIPMLFRYLLDNYSFMGALIIFSGVCLHIIPAALLMRPFSFYTKHNKRTTDQVQLEDLGYDSRISLSHNEDEIVHNHCELSNYKSHNCDQGIDTTARDCKEPGGNYEGTRCSEINANISQSAAKDDNMDRRDNSQDVITKPYSDDDLYSGIDLSDVDLGDGANDIKDIKQLEESTDLHNNMVEERDYQLNEEIVSIDEEPHDASELKSQLSQLQGWNVKNYGNNCNKSDFVRYKSPKDDRQNKGQRKFRRPFLRHDSVVSRVSVKSLEIAPLQSPPSYLQEGYGDDEDTEQEQPCNCPRDFLTTCCCCFVTSTPKDRPLIKWDLFKNKLFVLYVISICLGNTGYMIACLYLPAHAEDIGMDRNHAALLLSIMGVVDLVGRIGGGWFADLGYITRSNFLGLSLFLTGIATFICIPLLSPGGLVGLSVVMGLFGGCSVSLQTVVLVDYLGAGLLSASYGLSIMCQGFVNIILPALLGAARDSFGSYTASYYMCASLMVLSGIAFTLEPCVRRWQEQSSPSLDSAVIVTPTEPVV